MATYAAETPRLYLQSMSVDEHFESDHAIMSKELCMNSARPPHFDRSDSLALLMESLPSAEKPWNERWAILLKRILDHSCEDNPLMIGLVGIVREQEIRYKIDPNFWGKGYMTEALEAFIRMFWIFPSESHLAARRIGSGGWQCKDKELWESADPENLASVRILEKMGFKKSYLEKDRETRPYAVTRGRVGKSDLQRFYFLGPGN